MAPQNQMLGIDDGLDDLPAEGVYFAGAREALNMILVLEEQHSRLKHLAGAAIEEQLPRVVRAYPSEPRL